MPIVLAGSLLALMFAAMLEFCLVTGLPCPVDGFDEATRESPAMAGRFMVTIAVLLALLGGIFAYALSYTRKKLEQPRLATVLTAAFALIVAMLWGMAESGVEPAQEVLIFASIQFLIAGLLVFDPFISLVYFGVSFSLFGFMLNLTDLATAKDAQNLVYLCLLDVIVSWVVYGLFIRGAERERAMAEQSRRDELTGAKNRHYLRDDFNDYFGENLFVMLCDIDDFKRCNDEFSHDMGDKVLREFFFALRDAFGDEGTYRYGGDEFLIVAVDLDDDELAYNDAKVKDQMAKVSVGGQQGTLTYSGGYVRGVAEDNAAFRAMLHRADENLLEAKRTGKKKLLGG